MDISNLEKKECPACGEYIFYESTDEPEYAYNEDGEDVTLQYSPKIDAWVHEYDFEDDILVTVMAFTPDGSKSITHIGKLDNYPIEGDIDDVSYLITEPTWKNTDGWRGYMEYKPVDPYTELADGWITGYPDETTTRKADLGELFQNISEGKLVPPVTMYWTFARTSNVFSQSSSLLVKWEDVNALNEWLAKQGWSTEKLQEAFS